MPEDYDRITLMGDMLCKTGANFSKPGATRLAFNLGEAVGNCFDCGCKELCRNWLEEALDKAAPPDFCPNARFLKSLMPEMVQPTTTSPQG